MEDANDARSSKCQDKMVEGASVQSFSTVEFSEVNVNLPTSQCKPEVSQCQALGSSAGAGHAMAAKKAFTKSGAQEMRFSKEFVDGLEARFLERCKSGLGLDGQMLEETRQLFRETKTIFLADTGTLGTASEEETERLWTACILYTFKKLSLKSLACDHSRDSGFTLNQVFDATNLRVSDFCKELPHFVAKAGSTLAALFGDDYEKRLEITEWRANYFHLAVLYDNYARFYDDFFLVDVSRGEDSAVSGPTISKGMKFGWILFIAFRIHALGRFPDLVTSINGLLAIFISIILHMPSELRKFSFQDTSRFVNRNSNGVNILSSLCFSYNAEEKDVKNLLGKLNSMIQTVYNIHGSKDVPDVEYFKGIITENMLYFEGLMEDKYLASNLQIIEKFYEEACFFQGELDGRSFLRGDDNVVEAISVCTSNVSCSKWEGLSHSSPTASLSASQSQRNGSPCSSPTSSSLKPGVTESSSKITHRTPISITMSTAKWLRNVIGPLAMEPSAALQLFFRSCDYDITKDVSHRLQVLLDAIFPKEAPSNAKRLGNQDSLLLDDSWVEDRRAESLKIYYRVLGRMCQAESQRLKTNNLTSLLCNETFHRCIVACSAELVLATHKTITRTFPAVVSCTGITAFDLSKIIESFIRSEETLPRELKRHLNSIDERLLESMAWERGSSMFNLLIVARPSLAKEINQLGLLASPMPSLEKLNSLQRSILGNNPSMARDPGGEGISDAISNSPLSPASPRPIASVNTWDLEVVKSEHFDCTKPAGVLSGKNEQLSAFSTSFRKDHGQPPPQSAFSSSEGAIPVGWLETCAETVIDMFLQKVLKLAATRIRALCHSLHLSDDISGQVYHVLEQALQDATSLFFNRHLDQIIMCSIYGVCKVRKGNITFSTIVSHYRKQSHPKPYVFRNVFIHQAGKEGKPTGSETGHLIRFYNEIFVPATKCILLHLGKSLASVRNSSQDMEEERENIEGRRLDSPRKALFHKIPDVSPKRVSVDQNVQVSALSSVKVETLVSPNTKSSYACVGDSTHAFQSPSKDLITINNNQLHNRFRQDLCTHPFWNNFGQKKIVFFSQLSGFINVDLVYC